MRFTTAFILALAAAGLLACDATDSTGPEEPTLRAEPAQELEQPVSGAAQPGSAPEAAPASLGLTATRLPKSFFINPSSGNDSNPGTSLKPFKTLARGLSTAISGDTMRLAAGVYSAATNGEKFTNSTRQVTVPAGVKIFGTLAGSLTSRLEAGAAGESGLNLKGGATVRNLVMKGFASGIRATQGVQTLKSLVVDLSLIGLDLSGSAQTTLVSSTVFTNTGGLPSPNPGNAIGAKVRQQAQLTVTGGTIGFGHENCVSAVGVSLGDAARLTMKNGAALKEIAGSALTMLGTSKAFLTGSATIERTLTLFPNCTPPPSVVGQDSTTLTLKKARVLNTAGKISDGIWWQSRGLLTLDSVQVKGHTGVGIRAIVPKARILLSGSLVHGNTVGIQAAVTEVKMTVTGSTVTSNVLGIESPFFKLRGSDIAANQTGIVVHSPSADLGQLDDPGKNFIIGNLKTGVTFSPQIGVGSISASGNIWAAGVQGADGDGRYPLNTIVNGASPSASGPNFALPSGNLEIHL